MLFGRASDKRKLSYRASKTINSHSPCSFFSVFKFTDSVFPLVGNAIQLDNSKARKENMTNFFIFNSLIKDMKIDEFSKC